MFESHIITVPDCVWHCDCRARWHNIVSIWKDSWFVFWGTEKLHFYNCTNFCLQLHKIFYNCTICAQLHTKKNPEVHLLKFGCAGVSVVCNSVFRLTMSCCVREIFAIKSLRCAKARRNFDVWAAKFRGPPKCLTGFHKSGHRRTRGKVWWPCDLGD